MRKLAISLTLTLLAGLAQAAPHKLSKDLPRTGHDGNVDVIVQFHRMPSTGQLDRARGRGALRARLDSIHGAALKISAAALADLANDPDVKFVSLDRNVSPTLHASSPAVGGEFAAKYGLDGSGVTVAVIDSGIGENLDLGSGRTMESRVVHRENFIRGKLSGAFGHGTHVAGIIAGNGAQSSGFGATKTFRGIAPNAHLADFRVLDERGGGKVSDVIAAIQKAIKLKDRRSIRVINLSLGHPVFESYKLDPLCQAVEAAWRAGIVVVVAAGNEGRNNSAGTHGYGTINSPGNDPYVITVGAMKTNDTITRSDDLIASYSSKGPTAIDHVVKPDLVAPGNRIISLLDMFEALGRQYPENSVTYSEYYETSLDMNSFSYFKLSGTSMAAPMVSGAVALLLQKDPTLTPDQVKARLMKTSSKTFPASSEFFDAATNSTFVSYYNPFTIGAGYLDVAAALSNEDKISAPALSPTAVWGDSVAGSGLDILVRGED